MRAAYAADASNYRQVPIGVVLPRSVEDIVAGDARVRRKHAVPVLARGGGTSLNGQTVNVAVVIDCSKYLDRVLAIDARGAQRPRRARRGVRHAARRGRSARPHLRARPGHAFALHAGRHDRQQLLRPALRDGRHDRRQHRAPRGADVRRRTILVRSDFGLADLHEIVSAGEDKRRSTRSSKALPTSTATRSAKASRRSSAACRATTSTSCCRRTASTWRARWSAPKAPARSRCRPRSRLVKSPPERVLVVLGVPGHLRGGRRGAAHPGRQADRLRRTRRGDHRRPARARACGWTTSRSCRRARPG